MNTIPFLKPRFPEPEAIARDYEAIFKRGIFTNSGDRERAFARAIGDWIGAGTGVSVVANATLGLQLACRALFHRDRREVLVASFTFAAGPQAVTWCGYEPVFIDIDANTWQPDVRSAEAYLLTSSHDVAGILLTNTFGTANPAIADWEELARAHDLPLVIDSAAGFGAEYAWGERLGARGDCEVFSFHATKIVAVGEGGAVTARDPRFVERINRLKNFGFDAGPSAVELGTNAKLSELASAIGLHQIAALPHRVVQRRKVLSSYIDHLCPLGIDVQPGSENAVPPFLSALLPSSASREEVGRALDDARVGWRAYYSPPVHRQPAFISSRALGELPVTEEFTRRIISLPLHDDLDERQVAQIAELVVGAGDR